MTTGVGVAAPDCLSLAVAFHQAPARFPELMRGQGQLPEGVDVLLRLAGGGSVEEGLPTPPFISADELKSAALFFVEQVLLARDANHYRVLGVNPAASLEEIKEHHRLLMRLFHPDRKVELAEGREAIAARVNRAYNELRVADKREAYDVQLRQAPKETGSVHTRFFHAPRPIVPLTRRLPPVVARNLPSFVLAGCALFAAGAVGLVYVNREPAGAIGGGDGRVEARVAPTRLAATAGEPQASTPSPSAPPPMPPVSTPSPPAPTPVAANVVHAPAAEPAPVARTRIALRAPREVRETVEPAPREVRETVEPAPREPVNAVKQAPAEPVVPPPPPTPASPGLAITTQLAAPEESPPRPGNEARATSEPAEQAAAAAQVAESAPIAAPRAPAASAPAASAPAPSTAHSSPPPAPAPIIGEKDLVDVVSRLSALYARGDLDAFLALFDSDARIEGGGRDRIRSDYDSLFRTTSSRRLYIYDVKWLPDGDRFRGEGSYQARVVRNGEAAARVYTGKIRLEVLVGPPPARLHAMYH